MVFDIIEKTRLPVNPDQHIPKDIAVMELYINGTEVSFEFLNFFYYIFSYSC